MARNRLDYDFVTRRATTPHAGNGTAFGLRNQLYFHYFNPNGCVAKFREQYQRIFDALDEGNPNVRSGWLLAYQCDIYQDAISRMAMSKAFPNRVSVAVAIAGVERATIKLEKLLDEAGAE